MAKIKLEKIEIGNIIPYENNPRRNDKAVQAVANSLQEFGYINPIIVNEDMVVLAGHTRLKAMKDLGVESVEVVVVSGLTEEEERAFRIADNRTHEISDWDDALLVSEMKEAGGVNWAELGFATKDLNKLEPPEQCTCPKCGAKFYWK